MNVTNELSIELKGVVYLKTTVCGSEYIGLTQKVTEWYMTVVTVDDPLMDSRQRLMGK